MGFFMYVAPRNKGFTRRGKPRSSSTRTTPCRSGVEGTNPIDTLERVMQNVKTLFFKINPKIV